ncbi:MAG: type IV pilin protein [Ketobacteraceae bacterium]|nr:type IV pilin protein [Ketobacteraceae bacterium]
MNNCSATQICYRHSGGFTLVELLIVLAVISIIAAIGYPAYTAKVRDTNRKVAVGEILDVAASLERVKSQRFAYPGDNSVVKTLDGRYDIRLVSDATTYTISAVPVGAQAGDKCGTISYDNESTWTVSTGLSEAECVSN